MATELATAMEVGEYAAEAAKTAMTSALSKFSGEPHLVLLHLSRSVDIEKALKVIREELPDVPLLGCTAAGEFTREGVEPKSVAIGMLRSEEMEFAVAFAENVKADPEGAIRKMARDLPAGMANHEELTGILLLDGMTDSGEKICVLASHVLGKVFGKKVRLVGGCAADDLKFESSLVIAGDEVSENAAALCMIGSEFPLFTGLGHGHRPLSEEMTVTDVRENVVLEVDDRPAWGVWKDLTEERGRKVAATIGLDPDDEDSLTRVILGNYQLGLPQAREGEFKVRFPKSVGSDGSLSFPCEIPVGTVFRIMDGSDRDDQVAAARRAVGQAVEAAESAGYDSFGGLLVFECGLRLALLGDEFTRCVENYRQLLPEVPILGWETYGEIRMEPYQYSGFHNASTVVCLIPSEGGK
ncbi:hypothetical protein GF402_09025 [Candidatus Fermentibacteria bacterium]|nr:hypothetical protein [Candidatus Fermentibacteria bacterium]